MQKVVLLAAGQAIQKFMRITWKGVTEVNPFDIHDISDERMYSEERAIWLK